MRGFRSVAVLMALAVVAAGCGGGHDHNDARASDATVAKKVDYATLGLWDDGPCDKAREPLRIGFIATLESSVISLKSFGTVLQASAAGFNKRGGANGACIDVVICDDKGTVDEALNCVRQLDQAGVVATVNDQGTAGAGEVAAAMADAGIPRVATNVTNADWGDPNAYPTDAGGVGATFLIPQGLLQAGSKKIALVRVDLAQASALKGFLEKIYDDDGVSFVADIPVPAGTTDYSQFILAAQNAQARRSCPLARSAGGRPGGPCGWTDGQRPPTGSRVPTLQDDDPGRCRGQHRDGLALSARHQPRRARVRGPSGRSGCCQDPELAPQNVEGFALRGWIGLYALLRMIRDAGLTKFSGEAITSLLHSAHDVPMLGIFGDENWTPNANHPGVFQRAGTNHWAVYRWDPIAKAPGDLKGNFVKTSEFSFDKTLCGSPLGGPKPC